MCPTCIATTAFVVGAATSAGGVVALFARNFGGEKWRLFMVATEWYGFAKMMDGLGSGQVLSVEAPACGAGWP